MQCPVCHNEAGTQSAFCSHCGASLAAAVPPAPAYSEVPPASGYAEVPPAYTPPPPGYPPAPGYGGSAGASGLSANAAAAIAYLTFIPAILFLVLEPYNRIPLVRFHAFQSIGLAVVAFVLQVGLTLLGMTPFTFLLVGVLHALLFLVLFLAWLIAILKASKGEWFKLPVIGDIAMKQTQS